MRVLAAIAFGALLALRAEARLVPPSPGEMLLLARCPEDLEGTSRGGQGQPT